jgi:hypothetical protein
MTSLFVSCHSTVNWFGSLQPCWKDFNHACNVVFLNYLFYSVSSFYCLYARTKLITITLDTEQLLNSTMIYPTVIFSYAYVLSAIFYVFWPPTIGGRLSNQLEYEMSPMLRVVIIYIFRMIDSLSWCSFTYKLEEKSNKYKSVYNWWHRS